MLKLALFDEANKHFIDIWVNHVPRMLDEIAIVDYSDTNFNLIEIFLVLKIRHYVNKDVHLGLPQHIIAINVRFIEKHSTNKIDSHNISMANVNA